MSKMSFFGCLQCGFSTRRKALWLFRRGLSQAKGHDGEGAIASYTAAIDSRDVPGDVKAMALYNRALVYVAAGNDSKGVHDLEAIFAMDGEMMISNIKTMARQKLARMESRTEKSKVYGG